MNWIDLTMLSIMSLSMLTGLIEGFTRTVLSLFAWILSFSIVLNFVDKLATLLVQLIPFTDVRLGLSIIILFTTTFVIALWVNYLIIRSIDLADLSFFYRILGSLFGLMRGYVAIIFLVFFAGLSKIPALEVWQQSSFIPNFQQVAIILCAQLPPNTATQFNFKPITRLPSR